MDPFPINHPLFLSLSFLQSSQTLLTTILFSTSNGSVPASTYKREHAVFVFLCLAYFMQFNALQAHPCHGNDRILFFL